MIKYISPPIVEEMVTENMTVFKFWCKLFLSSQVELQLYLILYHVAIWRLKKLLLDRKGVGERVRWFQSPSRPIITVGNIISLSILLQKGQT